MALDGIANCGRGFLMTLNSFFGLLALGMAVLGMMVMCAKDVINDIMAKIIDTLTSVTGGLGGVDLSSLDIAALVGDAAIGLIVMGITLAAIAGIGIFGAKKKIKPLLIAYGILLILLVIGEVTFVVILITQRNTIDNYAKPMLQNFLQSQYIGGNGTDVISLTLDFLMSSLSCCGFEDYSDFNDSFVWDREFFFVDRNNVTSSIILTTPVSCCIDPSEMEEGMGECAIYPNQENSNYLKGCYEAIWDVVEDKNAISFGCLGVVGIFELSLIFFSFWLRRATIKEEKEKKKKEEEEKDKEGEEIEDDVENTSAIGSPNILIRGQNDNQNNRCKKNNQNSAVSALIANLTSGMSRTNNSNITQNALQVNTPNSTSNQDPLLSIRNLLNMQSPVQISHPSDMPSFYNTFSQPPLPLMQPYMGMNTAMTVPTMQFGMQNIYPYQGYFPNSGLFHSNLNLYNNYPSCNVLQPPCPPLMNLMNFGHQQGLNMNNLAPNLHHSDPPPYPGTQAATNGSCQSIQPNNPSTAIVNQSATSAKSVSVENYVRRGSREINNNLTIGRNKLYNRRRSADTHSHDTSDDVFNADNQDGFPRQTSIVDHSSSVGNDIQTNPASDTTEPATLSEQIPQRQRAAQIFPETLTVPTESRNVRPRPLLGNISRQSGFSHSMIEMRDVTRGMTQNGNRARAFSTYLESRPNLY